MSRGCLVSLTFVGASVVTWIGLFVYFMGAYDYNRPGDSGGTAMGVFMFLITGGVIAALVVGALAALLVWARGLPKE